MPTVDIRALASVKLTFTELGHSFPFQNAPRWRPAVFWLSTFREADGRWLLVHSACLIELTEFVLSPSLKRCNQHKFQEHRLIHHPRLLTQQRSDLFLSNSHYFCNRVLYL